MVAEALSVVFHELLSERSNTGRKSFCKLGKVEIVFYGRHILLCELNNEFLLMLCNLNSRMTVNLEMMWKEVAVICFKIQY